MKKKLVVRFGSCELTIYDTHRCDEGQCREQQPNYQTKSDRANGASSRHKLCVRKRGAITRRVSGSVCSSSPAEPCLSARKLSQPRSPLHNRAIDPLKQRNAAHNARPGAEAMHQRGPGRPCAGHGRERPVARGQPEVVQRDVLARGEKGRDRAPRDAAAQTGRGHARAERRVVEGFGREVHDYVSGDGVDSAGRDDDRARFCREVVEPEVFSGSGGKCVKDVIGRTEKQKEGDSHFLIIWRIHGVSPVIST